MNPYDKPLLAEAHTATWKYIHSCSLPIYRISKQHQVAIGTATLVEVRGKKYVVTAAHVADLASGYAVGVPVDRSLRHVTGLGSTRAVRAAHSEHDVAVIALDDPTVIARLRDWRFVSIEEQLGTPWFTGPFLLSGYLGIPRPAPGFNPPGVPIGLILGKYTGAVVGTADPIDTNNDILLDWPDSELKGNGGPVDVPRLQGLSGASVWAMEPEDDTRSTVWTASKQLRLVGIQSAASHGSYIRAKRWHLLWSAFRELDPPAATVVKSAVSSHWKQLEQRSKAQRTGRRTRRHHSDERRIADLEQKKQSIKHRADQKRVQKDPSLRHVRAAANSRTKAISATTDNATRKALGEAQPTLSACPSLNGVSVPAGAPASSSAPRSSQDVQNWGSTLLDFVKRNPGQRGEQIAKALNTDVKTMRLPMKQLIEEGAVKTKGERRGMMYFAV